MVFNGNLKGVSMKYQGCFMHVSWFGSFKGVLRSFFRVFQWLFQEVLRMKQGCIRAV